MGGILYAIGVGPGAPDLLTLRAVQVLHGVKAILAPASPRNEFSLALEIASPHLPPDVKVKRLEFPMTRDKAILESAWRIAAEAALEILSAYENAAFLTLGDPLIYSTFGYLMRELGEISPETKFCIISGITSFQAAAAKTRQILCEGEENLHILSGIAPEKELAAQLANKDPAVILKTYRNLPAIKSALQATGRGEEAILASLVERQGEKISTGLNLSESNPPYMSLILSPARK